MSETTTLVDDRFRDEHVYRLRVSGLSPRRLADQFGLTVQDVDRIVARRLMRIDNNYRAQCLALDLEAIGLAQAKTMQAALSGDLAAVHALAKLLQLKADLLGTFAPVRLDVMQVQAPQQTSTERLRATVDAFMDRTPTASIPSDDYSKSH